MKSELQYGLLFHADGKLLSCQNPQRIPTCSNVNGSMRVGGFLSRVNVKNPYSIQVGSFLSSGCGMVNCSTQVGGFTSYVDLERRPDSGAVLFTSCSAMLALSTQFHLFCERSFEIHGFLRHSVFGQAMWSARNYRWRMKKVIVFESQLFGSIPVAPSHSRRRHGWQQCLSKGDISCSSEDQLRRILQEHLGKSRTVLSRWGDGD